MRAFKLFGQLTLYYALLAAALLIAFWITPTTRDYLPVGGVEKLIAQADRAPGGSGGSLAEQFAPDAGVEATPDHVATFGDSLFWLVAAIIGALVTALPVSWVYMGIRAEDEYDQSLIGTIIMLPLVVTGIVIIVQNSLALAFSLAGIAGAVRFRNSLKSSGDALFILLSVGIGLSAGIGALELAVVMSIAFNYCFLALWLSEYGERRMMKRYWSDFDPNDGQGPPPAPPEIAAAAPPAAPAPPAA